MIQEHFVTQVLQHLEFKYEILSTNDSILAISENKRIIKAFSFLMSPKKEVVVMVYVLAFDLYPAIDQNITYSNFTLYSQINCNFQSFARGDMSLPGRDEKPFFKKELVDVKRLGEFIFKLKQCEEIFFQIESDQDLVELIKRRPRYSIYHKLYKIWLYGVWSKQIDPNDITEQKRRDLAIKIFNETLKSNGNYRDVKYIPFEHPYIPDANS